MRAGLRKQKKLRGILFKPHEKRTASELRFIERMLKRHDMTNGGNR